MIFLENFLVGSNFYQNMYFINMKCCLWCNLYSQSLLFNYISRHESTFFLEA